MKRLLAPIILLISLIFPASYAQQPVFRHYTVDEGLPSNEIYHVFQDSKGYVWIATNMGVSRYDGRHFKNFDKQDGLAENTVFEVYEDFKGRVWFVSFPCQLSYFENDSIVNYRFNRSLEAGVGGFAVPVKSSFVVSRDGSIKIGLLQEGLIMIDNQGNLKRLHPKGAESTAAHLFIEDGRVLVSQGEIMDLYRITIHNDKRVSRYFFKNIERTYSHRQLMATLIGEHQLVFSQNDFFVVFNDSLKPYPKFVDYRIFGVFPDRHNNIWIATDKNGAICYKSGQDLSTPVFQYLNGVSVSSIYEDLEGGMWFSTLAEGVYYLPSGSFYSYTKLNGLTSDKVSKVLLSSGKVIAGTNDEFINIIKGKSISNLKVSDTKNDLIQALFENKQGLWVGTNEYLYNVHDLHSIKKYENKFADSKIQQNSLSGKSRFIFSLKTISGSNDDGLWIGESNSYSKFLNGNVIYNSLSYDSIGLRVESILEINDSTLFLGATNGVYKKDKKGIINLKALNPLLGSRVTDLLYDEKTKQLLIGTKGSGLILYDLASSILQLTQQQGLLSNSISSMVCNNGCLWVATNKGLNCLELADIGSKGFKINSFTKLHGLISNEINQIACDDDNVYIATNLGLTVFNYKNYKPVTQPPPVYINSVNVLNVDTLVKSGLKLNYDRNFITLEFVGISFRDADNVIFKYRLVGLNDNWVVTNNNEVEYAFLPPGDYTFEVMAINADGLQSAAPAKFSFTILPPFWRTWWFISLSALTVILIVYLYYINRVKQIRKEHELRNDINWYRQQALGKQMDPHFVFNTLNSIQSFIIKNDRLASSQYLSKFARLMRLILNSSQKQAVPIGDEISSLSLYLELESLRFQQKFEYHLNVDDSIDTLASYIPPFLIQPFVENAIWHGIMGLKGGGRIVIHLSKEKNQITCVVEDNGVGRAQAQASKPAAKRDEKSLGISLVESRLKLLNNLYGLDMKSQIIDLFDANGQASGTRVIINLPIMS